MDGLVRFLYPSYATKIVLVAALVLLFAALRFLWFLKHKHEDVWISLGRPTFILNSSLANQIAIFKFLHNRDYKRLNDPKFSRISLIFLVALWGFIALFVIMFMSLVLLSPGKVS